MENLEQIKSLEQLKSTDFSFEEYKEFVVKKILSSFVDPYCKECNKEDFTKD